MTWNVRKANVSMTFIENVIRLPVVGVFLSFFMHGARITFNQFVYGGDPVSLSLQTVFLNPFALIAATIVLGGYFGKLNFRGLKLGSSGSLFVGLAL